MNNQKNNVQLRIAFIGAVDCVSGSSTLLEFTNSEKEICNYYLVDCGEYQENNKNYDAHKEFLYAMAKKIRAVFITHAHYDHIGLLPGLIENGFTGKIYCTEATEELTKIVLQDSMRVNKKNDEDIENIIKKMNFVPIDTKPGFLFGDAKHSISIDDGLYMYPLRTSHILGSCSFTLSWGQESETPYKNRKAIHFSGDIGPCDECSVENKDAQSIVLKDFATPYYSDTNKYIVLESTYGNKKRDKEQLFAKKIEKLADIIRETNNKGGTVLIPAFALQRMQEILVDLYYIQNYKKDFKLNPYQKEFFHGNNPFIEKLINKIIDASLKQKIEAEFSNQKKARFCDLSSEYQDKLIDILNRGALANGKSGKLRYYYCSPLGESINKVHIRHLFNSVMNDKGEIKYHYVSPLFFQNFIPEIKDEKEKTSKAEEIFKEILNRKKEADEFLKDIKNIPARVLIASSGMCDKGVILQFLELLKNENNTLILTGYQAEGTNGAVLKKLSQGGYSELSERYNTKLDNTDIRLSDIKCRIEDLSCFYSGHADQEQLVEYVHGFNNKRLQNTFKTTVFLNHGTREQQQGLKDAIESKNNGDHNITVVMPEDFKWFNLNTDSFEENVNTDIGNCRQSQSPVLSVKQKITINDIIDVSYPKDFSMQVLAEIIQAINNILNANRDT